MQSERRDRPMIGMQGLLLWLAVGSLLWYWLIGWPPPALPPLPQALPSWSMVDVWVRSPLASDWTGFVATIGMVGWAFWAWAWATVLLEVAVNLADAVTHGAAWVLAARGALRPVTIPFVRRAVDASLSGLMLARVALQPVAMQAVIPWQTEVAAVAPSGSSWAQASIHREARPRQAEVLNFRAVDWAADATTAEERGHELVYHVQSGDSLWAIAERFYGDGEQEVRLFAANVGQVQPDGGALTRHGVIQPNWILRVPEPTQGIESGAGEWWYTVQPGETLDSICARLLGDANRSDEVFQLNRGAQAPDGHVLLNPNLIWPDLRLRLPLDSEAVEPAADEPSVEAAPSAPSDVAPGVGVEPDRQDHTPAPVATAISVPATVSVTTAPTPEATADPTPQPVETARPAQTPLATPAVEQVRADPGHPLPPVAAAALGAAGLVAAAVAAGQLRVYKRKPGRDPDGPESEVRIEDGFAEVNPVEDLARRLARTSDPASAIASLLAQAYAAVFDEQLQPDERREATEGVTLAATRHGRTSTMLVLTAPVAARPHLVHNMRAAAERAFGEQVDVDGQVGQDGDVLVRVTWDPRRPITGDLLERVNSSTAATAWPAPCLVPALVLRDRQHLSINWRTLGNVLVAAPTGQSADVPLAALAAALASVHSPEDLGLVVVARPHTLSEEIGAFPHGLLEVTDPGDQESVRHALNSVKAEIDRRRKSGSAGEADLVVVVRELGDLDPDALLTAAAIAAAGPQHGVRLLAATELPVTELFRTCPFIDQLGTRLVLQTATEEDSVALLGMPGAERLGAGGFALLRLEGRVPFHGWAHRVSADNLARLAHMMGTRSPAAPSEAAQPVAASPEERGVSAEPQEAVEDVVEVSVPAAMVVEDERAQPQATPTWASPLLQALRAAPIRVRCFGASEVWHRDRLIKIGDPELLWLLAVHPVTGIKGETLADMLWDESPDDQAGALRKERSKLRLALRRLVPELLSDPLPGNAYHGEKVISLDPSVISSDVHEFTELLNRAKELKPVEAIEAYEAALALYKGDLLDSFDVLNYRWMYDQDPQVAMMLRSDFRSRHKDARLKLAGLLADGPESGLARAEELYSGLCGEDLENERLWTALFHIHERTGSSLGLESAVRRFRGALVELGTTDVTDIDRVPLPLNLDRLVQQIRRRISTNTLESAAGGD